MEMKAILAMLVAVLPLSKAATTEIFNKESNYVFPTMVEKEYPICVGNSICSFLQANDKGVSIVRYCQCSRGQQCPLKWDPYDGKSITQSMSDQYKYCKARPRVDKCTSPDQVAYTSVQKYSKFNGKKVANEDRIECVCPEGHNYLDTKVNIVEDEEFEIMEILYFCLPLQPCNGTEFCKDIVAKPGKYIVSPKCLCQGTKSACPTITNTGIVKARYGLTELQHIRCQEPVRAGTPYSQYMYNKRLVPSHMKKRLFGRSLRSLPNLSWGQ